MNRETAACYCIIPHGTEARCLVLKSGGRWALPRVQLKRGFLPGAVREIGRAVKSELGVAATVLRHIKDDGDCQIVEMEARDPVRASPRNSRWVGRDDCKGLDFARPNHLAVLDRWLSESEGDRAPPERAPWEKKGWFDEAQDWVSAHLGRLGYEKSGPLEQVKGGWGWSSVLRVPTTAGALYFKADYAKPPVESAVISALAERWPDNVPVVLAADPGRRWMLMRDHGGVDLGMMGDEFWLGAVRRFAEIQIDCADNIDIWRELGCPSMGPDEIIAWARRMLSDIPSLTRGASGLGENEIAELISFMPRLEEMCLALTTSCVPLSVHFQDFRHGNIAWNGHSVYYDLRDAVIAHPFFTINRFLDFIQPPPGRRLWEGDFARAGDEKRRDLRDAYLEPWAAFGPTGRLRALFAVSRQLNELYLAIRWYCELPYLEAGTPWEEVAATALQVPLRRILEIKASIEAEGNGVA